MELRLWKKCHVTGLHAPSNPPSVTRVVIKRSSEKMIAFPLNAQIQQGIGYMVKN